MLVSIVLPTFNESGNIVLLVNKICEYVPVEWDYEIIVVDDNSPDGTYKLVCETFAGNHKVKPVLRTFDRGFAKSIRAGIEIAQGNKIVVMDTDFTHSPEELPKLLYISDCYDIVSASRFCAGGNMQSMRHYLASFFYNLLIRIILHSQIQDNLGGYFIIDREKLFTLPFDLIFYGYGEYYFRLLFYAESKKITVLEIPANYRSRESGKSKSSFVKMLFSYTKELLNLRFKSQIKENNVSFDNKK